MTVTPMPQLRPLSMAQLLDRAIRLYRHNFFTFIGIIALVQIPISLLQWGSALLTLTGIPLFNSASPPTAESPFEMFGAAYYLGLIGSLLVTVLSFILVQVVGTAALTRAVAGSYLNESVGITDAYRKIGSAWKSLLGAMFLAGLVGLGLVIWLIVPCVGWLTGLGMLAFFSLVIVPLIAPIIVLEQQPASQAIRRAWDLARRRFWWVLGFVVVLTIFAQIVITGPTLLITYIFQFATGSGPFGIFNMSQTELMLQTSVQSLVQLVGALIYLPLHLTAITLMYFDLRIRLEGFDLSLEVVRGSDEPADFSEITSQTPRPEKGNWLTMAEMGNFVLVELGAVVVYILFVSIMGALAFAFMAAAGGGNF